MSRFCLFQRWMINYSCLTNYSVCAALSTLAVSRQSCWRPQSVVVNRWNWRQPRWQASRVLSTIALTLSLYHYIRQYLVSFFVPLYHTKLYSPKMVIQIQQKNVSQRLYVFIDSDTMRIRSWFSLRTLNNITWVDIQIWQFNCLISCMLLICHMMIWKGWRLEVVEVDRPQ